MGEPLRAFALAAFAALLLCACRLEDRPTRTSVQGAQGQSDAAVSRDASSTRAGASLCPDEGTSPGCCYGDNICGIELNRVCYPRAALVLDARGCDGGAPGPFAHGTPDAGRVADGGVSGR